MCSALVLFSESVCFGLDFELDFGLDFGFGFWIGVGLDFELDFGLDFGLEFWNMRCRIWPGINAAAHGLE